MKGASWLALAAAIVAAAAACALSAEEKVNGNAEKETNKKQALDAAEAKTLIARLISEKQDERTAAADRLVEAAEQAVPFLLKQLEIDDDAMRARVAAVLGRIDSEQVLEALHQRLKSEKSDDVRRELIGAVGNHRKPESIGKIREFLLNKNPLLRLETVMALGRIGDKSALPDVKRSSLDDDHRVRRAAVVAMGLLGVKDAIPALIDRLRDENLSVRTIAHVALKKISGKDFEFNPDDDDAKREEAVLLWDTWWKTQERGDTGGNAEKEEQ